MPKGTKANADLSLLTALERGEVVTQAELKHSVGVSVGLVNALLKRAIAKGLVKVQQAPYKRYAYYLTPKGFSEKSRLVGLYLESSLHLFRQAREQYAEIYQQIIGSGSGRIIFAGRGELAEIALLASIGSPIEILGIYDGESNVDRLYGLNVIHSLDATLETDVFVITDSRHPQGMFDMLSKHVEAERLFAPACLRIVKGRQEIAEDEAVSKRGRR